jgi:hypothetical protein
MLVSAIRTGRMMFDEPMESACCARHELPDVRIFDLPGWDQAN